jgi:Site-specific recombinase XerD
MVTGSTPSNQADWTEALQDFLLHVEATLAPKTHRFYATQLRQLALWADENHVPLAGFGKRHMDRYLVFRHQGGVSPSTLQHDAVSAKKFFRWCAREGILERSPMAEYQVRNAPAPARPMPSEAEIQALLDSLRRYWDPQEHPSIRNVPHARRLFFSQRNHALVLGLLDTACRIGEMLDLKVSDVRLPERQLLVRVAKGRQPRTLPLSEPFARVLGEWLKARNRIMKAAPEDEGYVFISESGGRMDASMFLKSLRRAAAFGGAGGEITLHSLRRFSLNRLAKNNLLGAQQIAGHKNPATTLLYTKLDPEFVRDVHEDTGVVRSILGTRREYRKKRLI